MVKKLSAIIDNFCIEGTPSAISTIGSGHINDSYLVATSPDDDPDYVLQRINHQIFKDIPGLMNDIEIVTRYIRNKLNDIGDKHQGLQVLELVPTCEGKLCYAATVTTGFRGRRLPAKEDGHSVCFSS